MTMTQSLLELVFRSVFDSSPALPTEGGFLFSETPDNELSVIETAADLVHSGLTRSLLVLDSPPRCGYGGVERWIDALVDRGLTQERLHRIPTDSYEILTTQTESQAFVSWAKQRGLRTAHIVAAPFHQLRAFITLVSVMLSRSVPLLLYSRPGSPQSWDETVVHSQGVLKARRAELIKAEMERIEKYRDKGDLASDDEIIRYLIMRDAGGIA